MKKSLSSFVLILLLLSSGVSAQKLELLKDINPNNPHYYPYGMGTTTAVYNNKLFFPAYDGVKKNLWMTDGTPGGTQMIDLDPSGTCTPKTMVVSGGKLFVATDDMPYVKLAVTDGTQAGTMILATFPVYVPITKMVTANNKVFFRAKSSSAGDELWVSDGTVSGTHVVKDICQGICSGVGGDIDLIAFNNLVYFPARASSGDRALWVSDGTEAGTQLLVSIEPENVASLNWFFPFNNKLYFTSRTNSITDLWVTDGTASGTQLIATFPTPGAAGSLRFKGACNGKMYFTIWPGEMLYSSDGTPGGTTPLKPFRHTGGDLLCYNNTAYFGAMDTGSYSLQWWRTDGTVPGTLDIFGASGPKPFSVGAMTVFNNQLFLSGDDSTNGPELWISDGTAGGSYKPFFPGISGSRPLWVSQFDEYNGSLYFRATYNGLGNELWRYSLWPAAVPDVQGKSKGLEVFPNPAAGVLTVQTNRTTVISIRNVLGQEVISKRIANKVRLDISFLHPGVYFVSDNGTGNVVKFLKQ